MSYIPDPEQAALQSRIDEAKARSDTPWNRGRLEALELRMQWIKSGRQQPLEQFPPYIARMKKFDDDFDAVAREHSRMLVEWIRGSARGGVTA